MKKVLVVLFGILIGLYLLTRCAPYKIEEPPINLENLECGEMSA